MNASPQFSFYQCVFRLCDLEHNATGYSITIKVNGSRCLDLMTSHWVTCDSNVEATFVDYAMSGVCRDVLIRVNTSLEESISVDIGIALRTTDGNVQPTKRSCPCLFSPPSTLGLTSMLGPVTTTNTPDILTTTAPPDVTSVTPTPTTTNSPALVSSTSIAYSNGNIVTFTLPLTASSWSTNVYNYILYIIIIYIMW